MHPTITIKRHFFALFIALSCISAPAHAGFIGKSITFVAGAVVGGPYIRRVLCPSQPYHNWSSLHQEAWTEVGNNISCVWNHTQELVARLRHYALEEQDKLHVVEEKDKENEQS